MTRTPLFCVCWHKRVFTRSASQHLLHSAGYKVPYMPCSRSPPLHVPASCFQLGYTPSHFRTVGMSCLTLTWTTWCLFADTLCVCTANALRQRRHAGSNWSSAERKLCVSGLRNKGGHSVHSNGLEVFLVRLQQSIHSD